jgi:hypothetical protein
MGSQYNETNVMHFSFNLLRIKGPLHIWIITWSSSGGASQTAFGILLAYNVSWLWHGCSETETVPQPTAVCVAPPEADQVMLETCRGLLILNKLNEMCITLVSLY